MVELTEPQVWTLMGIFAATMFAVIGVQSASFNRVLRAELGAVRTEMRSGFDRVDTRLGGVENRLDRVENRLDRVENRLDRVEGRLDGLDRDVQALSRKVFDD